MAEFDYSYLRGFIKEHFGTNQKFADFLGIGVTALYDRLKNTVSFKTSEARAVGERFNLSAEDMERLFFTNKVRKIEHNKKG
ncbi:toxin-antitoxin system, antitoxin component, Xre family [Veillonellaceae bacterium DNF00626]|nr:toxin-antitoxin system, antitoxin component, Xre family [Veillonellaceae bacterium DNF00626]